MKNTTLLICSFFYYAVVVSAQPVVTADILFAIGEQTSVHYCETPFAPGASGPDADWDFSDLAVTYSLGWESIAPAATAFADSFATATIAFFIPAAEQADPAISTYAYYRQNGNVFSYLGSVLTEQSQVPMNTSYFTLTADEDDIYSFPLEFGDSSTDEVEGTNTVNVANMVFVTDRSGSTTTEADAYGTLQTPAGTFSNVLRIKRTESLSDDFNGLTTSQEIVRYDWVSPDYRYLLMHMEEIIIYDFSGNEQSRSTLTYYSDPQIINSLHRTGKHRQTLKVYPNPSTDYLSINLAPEVVNQLSGLRIYGQSGELVHQQTGGLTPDYISIQHLPAGYYLLELDGAEAVFQATFIKH